MFDRLLVIQITGGRKIFKRYGEKDVHTVCLVMYVYLLVSTVQFWVSTRHYEQAYYYETFRNPLQKVSGLNWDAPYLIFCCLDH